MKLVLVYKLLSVVTDLTNKRIGLQEVSSVQADTFDSKLLTSPGIRTSAHSALEQFFDASANKTANYPEGGEGMEEITVRELEKMILLVKDGTRVLDTMVFSETDSQTFILKFRRTG